MTQSGSVPSTTAINLRRLVLLRSIALAGQALAIWVAMAQFHLSLPLAPLLSILSLLAFANLTTAWRLRRTWEVRESELFAQFVLDVLALTALLYFSGGSTNPFVSLYLLPLTLTAAALPAFYVWAMAALTVICYSLLLFFYVPLPAVHGGHEDFQLHVLGMWLGFILSAGLIAYFVVRMMQTLHERDQLRAQMREQQLRHERVLALGTLAAGAAHELATPLSTIAVLAKEIEREHGNASARTLREQVERCKGILGTLAAAGGQTRAEGGAAAPLDRYLDELLARFRAMRPDVGAMASIRGASPAPSMLAEATLSQALLNILNNAADASAHALELTVGWTEDEMTFDVRDRGPGLSAAAQEHAGEPFFSTKAPGAGMGLGLFLARGTIERLGGSLMLANHVEGGAICRVRLPLAPLRVSDA